MFSCHASIAPCLSRRCVLSAFFGEGFPRWQQQDLGVEWPMGAVSGHPGAMPLLLRVPGKGPAAQPGQG